jgi:hypothetical protein
VRTNNKLDSEVYVRNYCQSLGVLPTPYVTSHPDAPDLLCKRLKLDQMRDHPLIWEADAEYSAQPTSELDLQMQEAPNPLSRDAEITWQTTQYQEAAIVDLDGKAFVNSAGDPFDPPVEYQRSRWVMSVTKNLTNVPEWLPDYENAVNSDTFSIEGASFEAYTLRLSGMSISPVKREKIAAGIEYFYRVVSFRIEHNRDKWHPLKILDQGFRYVSGNERRPILEDNTVATSRPITTPALLDGLGTRLVNPSPTTAKYIERKVYPLKPFNGYLPTL